MGILKPTTFNSLRELFIFQLEDLYDAEHRIIDALPKLADAVFSDELKNAFLDHLQETREHVRRLEQIFNKLGCEPERETCDAMKGLVREGTHMIDAEGDSSVRDAALIAIAQRVEHYEIAGYGTVRTFARQLGLDDIVRILQQTLDEEGAADKLLTHIAETSVNAAGPATVPSV